MAFLLVEYNEIIIANWHLLGGRTGERNSTLFSIREFGQVEVMGNVLVFYGVWVSAVGEEERVLVIFSRIDVFLLVLPFCAMCMRERF